MFILAFGVTPLLRLRVAPISFNFYDDYSRKVLVYFLKYKNEVFVTFKQSRALTNTKKIELS